LQETVKSLKARLFLGVLQTLSLKMRTNLWHLAKHSRTYLTSKEEKPKSEPRHIKNTRTQMNVTW